MATMFARTIATPRCGWPRTRRPDRERVRRRGDSLRRRGDVRITGRAGQPAAGRHQHQHATACSSPSAIGYGFEEDRERPIRRARQCRLAQRSRRPIVVGDVRPRRSPRCGSDRWLPRQSAVRAVGLPGAQSPPGIRGRRASTSDSMPADRVFGNRARSGSRPPEEMSFLFSIVDSTTGREFQDEPMHNLASLGKSNGERPFRLLRAAADFAPRSTLRAAGHRAHRRRARHALHRALRLQDPRREPCPEPVVRQLRGPPECPVETIGNPTRAIIPFDLRRERSSSPAAAAISIDEEVPVNAEGGFVATRSATGCAASHAT